MNKAVALLKSIPGRIGMLLIRCYQLAISPILGPSCRFTPTCSEYGLIAIRRFGLIKGSYLTARRILRCRPHGGHGYDPVPEEFRIRLGK